jgi:very-short-patch-repair endonuclease
LPAPFDREPFRTDVAVEAGLGRKRLRGADLHVPFHGVRVPAEAPLNLLTRCRALQLRLPHAHFCGATAALLYGAPLPLGLEQSRIVHVCVVNERRAPTGKYIRGHRRIFDDADVRMLNGVRVSTPARMWCELGAVLEFRDLVAVGDYLIHHRSPLATRAELAGAIAKYPGRRGTKQLPEVLRVLSDRAESAQESRVRVLLLQGGLRDFRINHWVTTTAGKRYRIDIAFPEQRLAVEYQGAHHADLAEWRKGITRRAALEADRWRVLEIAANDVGPDLPELVRARLAGAGQ